MQKALEALMVDRTAFVVAHRLSTVRNADRIVVLSRGKVVEVGTHRDLYERGGEYRRLHEIQFATGGSETPEGAQQETEGRPSADRNG